MRPVEMSLGLIPTEANVEIAWAAKQIDDNGEFVPIESQERILASQLAEIVELDSALRTLRVNRT